MAMAEIISGEAPYYTIRVTCSGDRAFEQTIYSDQTGKALAALLQAYADDYEAGLPPVEEAPAS